MGYKLLQGESRDPQQTQQQQKTLNKNEIFIVY